MKEKLGASTDKAPSRLLLTMVQLLSLALFGLILWRGGLDAWKKILTAFSAEGNPADVLLSLLLTGLAGMLAAARLRLVAETVASGGRLASWRRFYQLNATVRAMGLLIPRSLSTFAGKPVALRALGLSLKRSAWIVLLDNLLDVILLSAWLIPALLFLKSWISSYLFIALLGGSVLALGLGVWWMMADTSTDFSTMASSRLGALARYMTRLLKTQPLKSLLPDQIDLNPERLANLLPNRSAEDSAAESSAIVLQALGLSIVINSALATRFYFIARAAGLNLQPLAYPWLTFAACFPLTQLSLVIAVTPGGLGIFDASWYGVLLLGGLTRQDALTFVVAQRAYIFVFVLIWAGFSVLLSMTVRE